MAGAARFGWRDLVRVWSSAPGSQRMRRPTDVLLLITSVLLLAALALIAPGPTNVDTALAVRPRRTALRGGPALGAVVHGPDDLGTRPARAAARVPAATTPEPRPAAGRCGRCGRSRRRRRRRRHRDRRDAGRPHRRAGLPGLRGDPGRCRDGDHRHRLPAPQPPAALLGPRRRAPRGDRRGRRSARPGPSARSRASSSASARGHSPTCCSALPRGCSPPSRSTSAWPTSGSRPTPWSRPRISCRARRSGARTLPGGTDLRVKVYGRDSWDSQFVGSIWGSLTRRGRDAEPGRWPGVTCRARGPRDPDGPAGRGVGDSARQGRSLRPGRRDHRDRGATHDPARHGDRLRHRRHARPGVAGPDDPARGRHGPRADRQPARGDPSSTGAPPSRTSPTGSSTRASATSWSTAPGSW